MWTFRHVALVLLSPMFAVEGAPASTTPAELDLLTPRDIFVNLFGPVESWTPIRSIDVDPNGIFEGEKANDSLIIGYEMPRSLPRDKVALATTMVHEHQERRRSIAARATLERRASCTQLLCCYGSGSWVDEQALYSAKDTFCIDGATRYFPHPTEKGESVYWQDKQWYQARDGSWQRFRNTNGKEINIFFYLSVRRYDIFLCQQRMEVLVTTCRGRNPDSAGGWFKTEPSDFWTIDPAE